MRERFAVIQKNEASSKMNSVGGKQGARAACSICYHPYENKDTHTYYLWRDIEKG